MKALPATDDDETAAQALHLLGRLTPPPAALSGAMLRGSGPESPPERGGLFDPAPEPDRSARRAAAPE